MRIACLLLLEIGSAGLVNEIAVGKIVERGRANSIKANQSKQFPRHRDHAPRTAGAIAPSFSVQTQKAGAIAPSLSVHTPKAVAGATALQGGLCPQPAGPNSVRHRSPNPAVIGGFRNSAARRTGSISGTGVHQRR